MRDNRKDPSHEKKVFPKENPSKRQEFSERKPDGVSLKTFKRPESSKRQPNGVNPKTANRQKISKGQKSGTILKTSKQQGSPKKQPSSVNLKRTGAGCPYAEKCGGCDYQGVAYEMQLQEKQRSVKKLLEQFAKVEPILGAKCPEHYRNKVHGVFGKDRKGNVYTGIYEEGSHRIVPVTDCRIEDERAAKILGTLCVLAKQFKFSVYNEDWGSGLLRHALIRTGAGTGEIMVVLVATSPILPSKNNFTKELLRLHPEITTIVLNLNDKDTNMVLGERNITLYGKGYIEDELCGLRFRISPRSFYQVNPSQTQVLYQKAMEFAALTGKEIVIDAYCGIGTIGMCAAAKAKEVIGVELNRDAVKDAVSNAKRNRIENIRFLADDAGQYMMRLAAEKQKVDVVLMDPPRSGSSPEFLNSLNTLKPDRIVYISCNPVTLRRDLELLTGGKGWKVKKIQPVDMFPFTEHIECVVWMQYCGKEKNAKTLFFGNT